jgi:lysophospholipase L1-like esterase
MYKQIKRLALAVTLVTVLAAAAESRPAANGEHWVATWGTAQQLMRFAGGRGPFGGRGPVPAIAARGAAPNAPAAPAAPSASTAPAQGAPTGNGSQQAPTAARGGPARRFGIPPFIADINDQTVRMILRTSIGGQSVRIRLANALGATTVSIRDAHIALRASDSSIVASSDRALTFSGDKMATLYAGQVLVSDPVALKIPPLTDIAVSLYIANDAGAPTSHTFGLRPTYVSATGDFAASSSIENVAQTTESYYWLAGVDVLAPADAGAIVTFGDSITDGDQSTPDTNGMWPAVLAARLQAHPKTRNVAVVNAGIAGNRILGNDNGGLVRFYHDALDVPGVKWITVLEGINDITGAFRRPGAPGPPPSAATSSQPPFSAATLIAAYKQLIALAHTQGVKVIGCTMTPFGGSPVFTEEGEAVREQTNDWIRNSGAFDAVVDFDLATRDSTDPHRYAPKIDSPDMLHPSNSGYEIIGNAFDLSLFSAGKSAPLAAKPKTKKQ